MEASDRELLLRIKDRLTAEGFHCAASEISMELEPEMTPEDPDTMERMHRFAECFRIESPAP
jgi:hypothetical protein